MVHGGHPVVRGPGPFANIAAMFADLRGQLKNARPIYPPPKESTMSNPDQAEPEDTLRTIEEAETLHEAVGLAIGAAFEPASGCGREELAEVLLDRIYDEPDQAQARERDAERERQARMDAFTERRDALELAIAHTRNLLEHSAGEDGSPVSIAALATEFHGIMSGEAERDDKNAPIRDLRPRLRGVDELFRDTTRALATDPSTQTHRHGTDTIQRDGNRLASKRGGYADAVSDAQILEHLKSKAEPLDHAFQIAVLAIRNYERLALRS